MNVAMFFLVFGVLAFLFLILADAIHDRGKRFK